MDGHRFDAIVRRYATGASRRDVLAGIAGAVLTALAVPGRAAAEPNPTRCRTEGRNCSKDDQCCSHYCVHSARLGHGVCAACESGIVCGDTCCPEGAVNGCTTITGPNGPVASCLCPEGTSYEPQTNTCGCPTACAEDADCCSGKCCQGVCCEQGEVCCGGVCGPQEDLKTWCVCPPGKNCSGSATCARCNAVYSTEDTCCPFPTVGYCCTDSAPGAGDGFALCCTPGVDCPPCPEGSSKGQGGLFASSCELDDCCDEMGQPGDGNPTPPCCLPAGVTCQREIPCCGACNDDGVCACLPAGLACEPFTGGCCDGLYCNNQTDTCQSSGS